MYSVSAAAYSASVASAASAASASVAAYSASVSAASALPTALPSGWTAASTSCIAEGTTGRALVGASTSGSNMTPQVCIAYCQKQGLPIAGLEYGGECYCGSVLVNGASLNTPSSSCGMTCNGNSLQTCGGPSALSLFIQTSSLPSGISSDLTTITASLPSGWSAASTSCVAEGSTGRALAASSFTSASMTVPMCLNYCQSKGYQYAGLEYSGECYCDSSLQSGASLSLGSKLCTMQCSGAPGTICGGPSALSLYQNPSLAVVKTSTTSAPVAVPTVSLPSGWSVASSVCVAEAKAQSGRALAAASTSSSSMTVPMCLAFCQSKGYQYAGVEYSNECYCDNSLSNGASLSLTSSTCNMPCSGDSTTTCGGPSSLSLYVNPSLAYSVTAVVNGFAKKGCIQEVVGRALTGASTSASNMTLESCTSYCSGLGFSMAGLEYASECYCGNSLSNGAALSLTSGQCNMACSGNSQETCGGPDAITLFSTS